MQAGRKKQFLPTTKHYHKDLKMLDDDWRRLTLWLNMNSNEIGWIGNDRN